MKHHLLVLPLLLCLARPCVMADAVAESAQRMEAALLRDYYAQQPPQEQVPPLPPAADAVFLRRACVDLAGRLPRAEEVRAYLADARPDKRAQLIDTLLKEPSAAEVRFRMLAEAFRVNDEGPLAAWLHQAAVDDLPFDQILMHLIGDGELSRRDHGNAHRTATEVAMAVLGEDLKCSQCHDHPWNDRTQVETYEFAACFTAGEPAEHLRQMARDVYRQTYVKEKPPQRAALLQLSREKPPSLKAKESPERQVARWIVTESSHRFATVAALRVWTSLFGMPHRYQNLQIGGVDPAEPWTAAHAPPKQMSNNCCGMGERTMTTWVDYPYEKYPSGGLAALTFEFRRCGHRLGALQRVLAHTDSYGREGATFSTYGSACYLRPAPCFRRLPAEVVWDMLDSQLRCDPVSARLPQVPPAEHPLHLLGRGTREWMDESTLPISHELVRFMMNSPEVDQAVLAANTIQSVEDIFLTIVGRLPSGIEHAVAKQHWNESPQTGAEDIAWALLNSKEFMFRF